MNISLLDLYDIELSIIVEWLMYKLKSEEEELDKQMQIVAWQTALLMNATGNFKRKIKPNDLYTPVNNSYSKARGKENKNKEQLQAELLESFADSIK